MPESLFGFPGRRHPLLAFLLTLAAVPAPAASRAPAALYKEHCASCHDPETAGLAPDRRAIRFMHPAMIELSMASGSMANRAVSFTPGERRALAEWLAGRSIDGPPPVMRLDYIHTGNAKEEWFRLDALVREGPWPGPLSKPADDTGSGLYLFEVRESASDRLLYSRGFASIFGEWQLTAEAKRKTSSFPESVRFPFPDAPVRVALKKRDAENRFGELWSVAVDPSKGFEEPPPPAAGSVWAVMRNGEPEGKVDVVLLGDGYTRAEMEKWHADARRLAGELFSHSPFRERRGDFNVWAIDTPAAGSGVARPSDGVLRDSPVGAAYDAFGSERYILALDNKRWRDIAAAAPYEFVVIVANGRKYGGGGIHNLYATVASDNAFTPYIMVHEFGHHIAGLADEYYTSDVAYEEAPAAAEPWEPNVTRDPRAAKWRALLTPGVPLPTPWPKEAFEELQGKIQAERRRIRDRKRPEEEMEALFADERRRTTGLLGSGPHAAHVGAFEGAAYQSKGYYRPQADCIMFTRDEVGFCAVCRRAIERVIGLYAPRR